MKVLVDTSVWSNALRREMPLKSKETEALKTLIDRGAVLMTGIILQELLQGIKHLEQFKKLKEHLSSFDLLEPTRMDHENAALLFSLARSKGLSFGTIDCLIASMAIENDVPLLTQDADFKSIAKISRLRLFEI
jgi:hypothetical protein